MDLFADFYQWTVTSGGTSAPAAGTSEAWTVSSSTGAPAASNTASPPTQFRVVDAADTNKPPEVMAVTNVSGTSWTVTRGVEGAAPWAHAASFTAVPVLTAGAMGAVLQQVPGVFNVKDYGAKGDSSTDDTTAIQNAINAIKSVVDSNSGSNGGKTLYFPEGLYKISATLDFTGLAEVRILGYSGRASNTGSGAGQGTTLANNPSTGIFATAVSGISNICTFGDSEGIVWDGVSFMIRNTFTGKIMNWDSSSTNNRLGNRVQNCRIWAVEPNVTALVSLDGQIEFSFDNVAFVGGGSTGAQVKGIGATAGFSNAVTFGSCSFLGTREYSVLNPGQNWSFFDCVFEPGAVSVPCPVSAQARGAIGTPDNLVMVGCGFWDNTGSTGSCITSTVATKAWSFVDCFFESSVAGPIFDLSGHTGLSLIGCQFDSPGGGTPSIFDAADPISGNNMWAGNLAVSPVVDNHALVMLAGSETVTVPASGTAVAAADHDRTFYVTAGSSTCTMAIQHGPSPVVPSAAFGAIRVPAGLTVTPTYTGAPTWLVMGE